MTHSIALKPASFYLLILMVIIGCSPKKAELAGINNESFKQDAFGCKGYRASVKNALNDQLLLLKQLTEPEIKATLGKPDQTDLGGRSQKYFKYYLDAAPSCKLDSNAVRLSKPMVLLIRFNSLNRVSEASIGVE